MTSRKREAKPGRPVRPGFALISISGGVLLLAAGSFLAMSSSRQLPAEEVRTARERLAAAEAAGAAVLAPEAFEAASATWQQVLAELDSTGWLPYGRFAEVRELAEETMRLADYAAERANRASDSLVAHLVETQSGLKASLAQADSLARRFPGSRVPVDMLTQVRALRARALAASDAGQVVEASLRLEEATGLLQAFEDSLGALDASLLASSRAAESIARFPQILVDKRRRLLVARYSETDVDTFHVELGAEWMGDKQQEGDRRTPEGQYRVSRKLGRGQSRYHMALLLDYPNEADRSRFRAAREAGQLTDQARIGGLIEIHGEGGKGGDWTDGCVALTNEDMARLFARIPVDTPVLIAPALL
ncbi:MAG: L,D-transpeptidase family protein [Rhodothermales bacterium]|nr:L,D-transpeptidase family protein [Rhodothermales bacterium]MBO6778369.1 L,D-transpeptidase family protein [Rhodothermales bacterium]